MISAVLGIDAMRADDESVFFEELDELGLEVCWCTVDVFRDEDVGDDCVFVAGAVIFVLLVRFVLC